MDVFLPKPTWVLIPYMVSHYVWDHHCHRPPPPPPQSSQLFAKYLLIATNQVIACFRGTKIKNFGSLEKNLQHKNCHQRSSVKEVVLKNFAIFTGKHLFWSCLLIKLFKERSCRISPAWENTVQASLTRLY